jgi:hypothetical protein
MGAGTGRPPAPGGEYASGGWLRGAIGIGRPDGDTGGTTGAGAGVGTAVLPSRAFKSIFGFFSSAMLILTAS